VTGSDGTAWRNAYGSAQYVTFGTTPAASGLVRMPNNVAILAARNAANSADLNVLSTNGSDKITVGDLSATASILMEAVGEIAAISSGDMALEAGTDFYLDSATLHLRSAAHAEFITVIAAAGASILGSSGATSLTVGTNKSAATLILQADAATTVQTLASTGTELANLSTPAAGTGPRLVGASGRFEVVDSDGTVRIF